MTWTLLWRRWRAYTRAVATRYYTADNPRTGAPYAVWRAHDGMGTDVYDPAAGTWVSEGWPAKFLHGADLNFSDLDPADLPAMLDQMRAGAERGPPPGVTRTGFRPTAPSGFPPRRRFHDPLPVSIHGPVQAGLLGHVVTDPARVVNHVLGFLAGV
jgi:hypothetical protein